MATSSAAISPFADLATRLLVQQEVMPRAAVIAAEVAASIPGCAAVIYTIQDPAEAVWAAKAHAGDVQIPQTIVVASSGKLAEVADADAALVFTEEQVAREDYAHLDVRRTVAGHLLQPLRFNDTLCGAIEVLGFEREFTPEDVRTLSSIAEVAAPALAVALDYERERHSQLEAITRTTQLYDVEKVFHSFLEMDELLPIIASKTRDLLNVRAANVWMLDGGDLVLTSRAGADESCDLGHIPPAADGIFSAVLEDGEPVLITATDDERLVRRSGSVAESIGSLVAVGILHEGAIVGVLELIDRLDGKPFDDDDVFVAGAIAETASRALYNASLLLSERKVQILETLVRVSTEITSTLNLERVLDAIVNGPQAVIPYERAAIAMEQKGRLRLKAVSGMPQLRPGDPALEPLREMLEWASLASKELHVVQHGEEIAEPRPETRARFATYFAQTGMRGFYCVPLADDQGRVGILCFESSDPEFLNRAQIEMIKVLVGQATVALRNAELYQEVPFIGVIQPLMQQKGRFLRLEKRKRLGIAGLAAGVVLFFAFVPLPMRVDGNALVAPSRSAEVQAQVEGVIRAVHVREGDSVAQGTIVAELDDMPYRQALVIAQSRHAAAVSALNQALAGRDGREAGVQRVQAEYWAGEVQRARERLERTRLRAPIAGLVGTPHVENMIGRKLATGERFALIADAARATVDVAIDEQDVSLLHAGAPAAVKLESFPSRTFHGKVAVVSPLADSDPKNRVFFARVDLANDGSLRPGMQGRGKVSAGWHAAGYVFFRSPASWAWSKLWSWFGW